MKIELPAWALRAAKPGDRDLTSDANLRGTMQIEWPDMAELRRWAGDRGWPAPWLGFENAFIATMLKSDENFALALDGSGIAIRIPVQEAALPSDHISGLDRLYTERAADGTVVSWGILVDELREIRRAVEAGVVVTIEGSITMRTWNQFYTWAHGRYHSLEDGYDQWIGNDGP